MKKRFDKAKLRKALNAQISPEMFDRWLVSGLAFVALAAFGLWPVLVLVPTLSHLSFDRMVDWNMTLLDKTIFPLAAMLSVAVYVLALVNALSAKRSPLSAIRKNPTLLIFLALVVWMIVDIWPTNGVTQILLRGAGLKHETFPLHLEYFLCFLPLGVFLRNPRLKLWLLRGMTIVSLLLAASSFYLWRNLTASGRYYDWSPVLASIFTNINYYGYFLTVFIGLSAALMTVEKSKGWRWLFAFSLALNTVVLTFNNTFGAWIAAFCACLFVAAARRALDGKFTRRALAPLAIFTLTLCLTGLLNGTFTANFTRLYSDVGAVIAEPDAAASGGAGAGRWRIWTGCMKQILQHPLFGIGFEGIHVRNLVEIGNGRPHNELMQYTLFYGVPGGLLYLCGCVGLYVRAWRRRAHLDGLTFAALSAVFGYHVGSNFGLTVYNTAPYLFIMMGLGYASDADAQSAAASPPDADAQSAAAFPPDADAQSAAASPPDASTQKQSAAASPPDADAQSAAAFPPDASTQKQSAAAFPPDAQNA